jgi:hypothetical protein
MGDPHRIKAYALIQGNTEGSLYLNELKYCITNNNGRINLIGSTLARTDVTLQIKWRKKSKETQHEKVQPMKL